MKRRALIRALAVLPVLAAVGAAVAAGAFDGPKNSTARFHDIARRMRGKLLIDLRNIYDRRDAEEAGLAYRGVGRGRS